ncbi:2-hydroxy-3-oxopropionate reductase [Halogeometricum pallidum JCM 14848]|uniref:2-hydroxy-3-oxopropionate reductase n=1 Tax=Halogeometricum pallidum JCM 14848 TaxID=1227487 RepID=M0D110_HALPD|nr:NAD(P)-binding domain-containing protein [Halogeometricum pallidum]ELZ28528.1 2-hydroxy-3-oxopropionate reductase [Halogeometricum pallidum JCM 14848]
MDRIGLVGVGYIGTEFLDRLLPDREVTVYDTDDGRVERAVDRGATAADSPAAVAEETDAVVMAVPGTPEVEATMEGENGLAGSLSRDQLLVDATTTHPDTSLACEELCAEAGAKFVEAPITGAAPREGYQMMIGGTGENYAAATALLDVLSDAHVRVGPVPDGTILKIGLQMRYAGRRALDAEIVEFARDNGVDPTLFAEFFGMDVPENYFTGDFTRDVEGLGGRAIWDKDIGYARSVAHEEGTALPMNAVVHEAFRATRRLADDDEKDASALIRYWMALNGAEDRYE